MRYGVLTTLVIGVAFTLKPTWARDHAYEPGAVIAIAQGELYLSGPNAEGHLDAKFSDLTSLAATFRPYVNEAEGNTYRDYRYSRAASGDAIISFEATTVVRYIITRRVTRKVKGVLHGERLSSGMARIPQGCSDGYRLSLDLRGSDRDITLQTELVEVDVCTNSPGQGGVGILYFARMIVGQDYGVRVAGRVAREMLTKQVAPLIQTLKSGSGNL
jgi:hypothetical protein